MMLSAVKGVATADEGVPQAVLPFFTQNLFAAGVSDEGSFSSVGSPEDKVVGAWEDNTMEFSGDNLMGTSEDDICEHLYTASLK